MRNILSDTQINWFTVFVSKKTITEILFMSFRQLKTGAFELTPDLVIREWDLFSSDYGVI